MFRMTDDAIDGSAGASAALQKAFNFTESELAENRSGRMSAAQSARMTKGQKQSRVGMYVMIGIVVVFLVIVAVIFIPQSAAPQPASSSAIPPWIIVVVIVVVALIMLVSFAHTRRGIRGLTGALLSVDGEANPKASMFGDANQAGMDTIYRVRVGDVNFPVTGPSQVDAFDKGKRYRAYYVKSTVPVLISAELLDV
jgi:heme/copper-type cytochrome/quinol oxidase subunit 4